MFLILLPLVQGRDWGWPAWGWGLLATGVITVAGFLTHERALAHRGGQPVLDPGLLRVRPFTAGLAASVLFFGGLASFFLVLSIYLQTGTGRSAWHTGLGDPALRHRINADLRCGGWHWRHEPAGSCS